MSRLTLHRVLASGCAAIAAAFLLNSVHAQVKTMPEFRCVVMHKPGPQWKPGVPPFEQAGLRDHVEHYRKLLLDGKLTLGGPFIDEPPGGMMIPEASVSEAEMRTFAAADPAVQSGLLVFEIRQWLPALRK